MVGPEGTLSSPYMNTEKLLIIFGLAMGWKPILMFVCQIFSRADMFLSQSMLIPVAARSLSFCSI